jgi:hypothetical protein
MGEHEATDTDDSRPPRQRHRASVAEVSLSEIRWRQYALYVDLYKYFFEITIKYNVFYYVITGGIVSFCLSRSNVGIAIWSLVLPRGSFKTDLITEQVGKQIAYRGR